MSTFAKQIDQFVQRTGHNGDRVLQMTVERAMMNLIRLSQVDTGNFRSYWRLGVNQPTIEFDVQRRDRLIALGHGRTRPPVPPTEALQSLFANVSRLRFGDVAYITNDANYAVKLNARRPMVQLTINDLMSWLV